MTRAQRVLALLTTSLVVACTAATTPSATPGPIATEVGPALSPPTATATAIPTVLPAGTPAATDDLIPTDAPPPTPAPVICPPGLPTSIASVADLADPSCYGSVELTVDAWLAEDSFGVDEGLQDPTWTMPLHRMYARPPAVADFTLDFMFATEGTYWGPTVVTPPASGVDLSGLGRWVRLRGHFNDARATACQSSEGPDVTSDQLQCNRDFVVSALESLPGNGPACPTASPVSVRIFLATDARCFLGRDVQIAALEDQSEVIGGQAPLYTFSHTAFRVAPSQLVSASIENPDSNALAPWIFPWTLAGSSVTFDRRGLKVIVTGHYGDPAASTCRPDPYPDWNWSPPIEWAQHQCERFFVITKVVIR